METIKTNTNLRLKIKPEWSQLKNLRAEIREFLEKKSLSKKQIDAMEMVSCELAENAIKYGVYPEPDDTIDVEMDIKNSTVIIEVKHKVNPDDVNLQILDSRIQWIRSFQNPFQAFVDRLKFVSGKPLADSESGLGLVRIAYEGHSILDFYFSENNVLAISAIYKL